MGVCYCQNLNQNANMLIEENELKKSSAKRWQFFLGLLHHLAHWYRDKMVAIPDDTFKRIFVTEMLEMCLRMHQSFFLACF